jgi:hypothetical protein
MQKPLNDPERFVDDRARRLAGRPCPRQRGRRARLIAVIFSAAASAAGEV